MKSSTELMAKILIELLNALNPVGITKFTPKLRKIGTQIAKPINV